GVMVGVQAAEAAPFPAVALPKQGEGYLVPDTWLARGLRFGTAELVGMIERAAQAVEEDLPGGTLYVADMALGAGGWTQWHRSHRTGCDVDLIYYAVDDDGAPAPVPEHMAPFDERGVAVRDGMRLTFDSARNWALVRAILTDPEARVVRIFVAERLR